MTNLSKRWRPWWYELHFHSTFLSNQSMRHFNLWPYLLIHTHKANLVWAACSIVKNYGFNRIENHSFCFCSVSHLSDLWLLVFFSTGMLQLLAAFIWDWPTVLSILQFMLMNNAHFKCWIYYSNLWCKMSCRFQLTLGMFFFLFF